MLESLDKKTEQPSRSESRTRLVEQVKAYLRSGDFARAADSLRSATVEFPNDAELAGLEKSVQEGVGRKVEADRLITESQELFAQQKSPEAIELLRKAYELDKRNSLARAILANALVEHAQSVVDTDWLKAETLTNQALALNPAHPTAKSVLNLIIDRKTNSPVDDWVSQARKLQSSGDLFAALAWVAEGLAVHPHDTKLLQIQDAIQRDQDTRRRQARRGDLDDLRRMQREIDGAADVAAKQALAERIQGVAAKHWTDGEILSIANALLLRLGLVSKEISGASARGKGAPLILHVPRPNAARPSNPDIGQIAPPVPTPPSSNSPESSTLPAQDLQIQVSPNQTSPEPVQSDSVLTSKVPSKQDAAGAASTSQIPPKPVASPAKVASGIAPTGKFPPSNAPREKATTAKAEQKLQAVPTTTVSAVEPSLRTDKVKALPAESKQPTRSNATPLILVSACAIILVAATFFFTRRHYDRPDAKTPAATTTAPTPGVSVPAVSTPDVDAPETAAPSQTITESVPVTAASGDAASMDQRPTESKENLGTLLIVTGQDNAKVFLNGKLQRQLSQSGQLRLSNLEPKDYAVRVSKSSFQDPPEQRVHIRIGDEAKVIFNLQPQSQAQPQPRLASLSIQGGAPGTTVLIDQSPVGTVQSDGVFSVATVNPGDHIVELRKDRFKPRQLKEHFVAGATVSLSAADASLEASPAELKITFTPPDANVAIVKGDLLKVVSSGVPLTVPAGTYTLTARTAERFTRSSTVEIVAGQSKTLDLSLAPSGMSKWEDPGAWNREGDSFTRKGGEFVLYGDGSAAGTFVFSAMATKGRLLQWIFNYSDPKNYVLLQMDDNNFYRCAIRNGQKSDEVIVPHRADKKTSRMIQVRVSATELVHQVKDGDRWTVLDRWTQSGVNLSAGKFGFYIPGSDQISLSSFAHYADLNIR